MRPSSEKRAFEAFLRHGRLTGLQATPTPPRSLSLKTLGDAHPTNHYTWRTVRDEKVRSAHAANDGPIFAWDKPPATGHPGQAHNCRRWAEPYYGTPMVPDARLALTRNFETDTSGREFWASLETQIRPDGSLARSTVSLRDGAQIQSTFVGSSVTHNVRLSDGRQVRVERRDGIQSVFAGGTNLPVTRSVWTPEGPAVAVPRRRVAQGPTTPSFGPANEFDEIELVDPARLNAPPPDILLAIGGSGLALLALFNILTVKPETLGAGSGDVAAVAYRVWKGDKGKDALGIALEALTAEQVAQSCKRLPDVRTWTDGAVAKLAPFRAGMGPQQWGTAVHKRVQREVERLKAESPKDYSDIEAELSIDPDDPRANVYGRPGSTRLDVAEDVKNGLVCVYDVKTGASGLTAKRVAQIAAMVVLRYGSATFFIIEVRPTP